MDLNRLHSSLLCLLPPSSPIQTRVLLAYLCSLQSSHVRDGILASIFSSSALPYSCLFPFRLHTPIPQSQHASYGNGKSYILLSFSFYLSCSSINYDRFLSSSLSYYTSKENLKNMDKTSHHQKQTDSTCPHSCLVSSPFLLLLYGLTNL